MYIGEKFYIGRASDINKRISCHKSNENTALSMYLFGNKKAGRYGNIKIAVHLSENISIDTVYIDILEVCENKWQCKLAEKKWVKAFYHMVFHDLLLNIDIFNNYPDTYLDKDILGDMMNPY